MRITKKTKQALIVLLVLCVNMSLTHAQELARPDFNVSFLNFDDPFDSIAAKLGSPQRTEIDDLDSSYVGFYYPKLIVFKNKRTNRLSAFHIYDSSMVTRRGLRVGDPISKAERLYHISKIEKHYEGMDTRFDLMGAHDYSFRDYSRARILQSSDYNLILFEKDQRLVKMLFYLRIDLAEDEYDVDFLKLGSPFDSVLAHFGTHDTTMGGDFGSTGYFFPKVVLWREDKTNTLFAFDIYDPHFVTKRGVRVGDSLNTVELLYRDCSWEKGRFHRLGPYDSRFSDYTEYTAIEGYKYFVFFIKEGRVVKMLSYIGVWD